MIFDQLLESKCNDISDFVRSGKIIISTESKCNKFTHLNAAFIIKKLPLIIEVISGIITILQYFSH